MGSKQADKWYNRAREYKRILLTKGVKQAGRYLAQYEDNKLDKLVNALWDVCVDDQEDGYRPRRVSKLEKVMREIRKKRALTQSDRWTKAQIAASLLDFGNEEEHP